MLARVRMGGAGVAECGGEAQAAGVSVVAASAIEVSAGVVGAGAWYRQGAGGELQ